MLDSNFETLMLFVAIITNTPPPLPTCLHTQSPLHPNPPPLVTTNCNKPNKSYLQQSCMKMHPIKVPAIIARHYLLDMEARG